MKSKKEMLRVLKPQKDEIVLDTTGRKTAEVHICVFPENVWKKRSKIMDSSVH